MAVLALLLALAIPLGAPAGDPAVGLAGDGVQVRVPGGIGAEASPQGVRVDAEPAGLATGVDLSLETPALGALPQLPLLRGAEAEAFPAAASAPSSQADQAFDWTPAATPAGLAAGGSILGAGLAAALAFAHAMGSALWPSFSRIEDDRLADHPTRRQALDFIAANPGATIQDVRRALGIAWGTAVHHLGRLERGGLVAVRHVAGHRGHWPLGQAPKRDALPPADLALVAAVVAEPGLPQAELARRAGLLAPAACKRLARLEEAGLVAPVRDGRSRLYRPTPKLLAMALAPATPVAAAAPMVELAPAPTPAAATPALAPVPVAA